MSTINKSEKSRARATVATAKFHAVATPSHRKKILIAWHPRRSLSSRFLRSSRSVALLVWLGQRLSFPWIWSRRVFKIRAQRLLAVSVTRDLLVRAAACAAQRTYIAPIRRALTYLLSLTLSLKTIHTTPKPTPPLRHHPNLPTPRSSNAKRRLFSQNRRCRGRERSLPGLETESARSFPREGAEIDHQ